MPSLPPLDIRAMFPAKLVDFLRLLRVGTGGGTAEPDGLCTRAELIGLHGGSTDRDAMNWTELNTRCL